SRDAPRILEASDPRLPAGNAGRLTGGGVVLVDVPERAVVRRIDVHVGVVAPARVRRPLHAGAVDDGSLAEGHLAERVPEEAAGVADAGIDRRAVDHAVAQRHVALRVLRDRAHPPVHPVVRYEGPLLVDRVPAADTPDLVPADAGDARERLDRLIGHQRLVRPEVAIGETEGG